MSQQACRRQLLQANRSPSPGGSLAGSRRRHGSVFRGCQIAARAGRSGIARPTPAIRCRSRPRRAPERPTAPAPR